MSKQLNWTPELIQRFWDNFPKDALDSLSFGRLAGPLVCSLVEPWITKGDSCLDYGGGDGHMAALLAKLDVSVTVFDPSKRRTETAAQQCDATKTAVAVTQLDLDKRYDCVICCEVIEHIPQEGIDKFADDLTKCLKDSGLVFLTTPNNESLNEAMVYCPVCDHHFHRWQHTRSWGVEQIVDLFLRHGVRMRWVGAVGFDEPEPIHAFLQAMKCHNLWPHFGKSNDKTWPRIGSGRQIFYIGEKVNDIAAWLAYPDKGRELVRPFVRSGAKAWCCKLGELASDDDTHPGRSRLVLTENGIPIGPAHSIHCDVRNLGGGRYSHWRQQLYFSTSDGSDPNENCRAYRYYEDVSPWSWNASMHVAT